MGKLALGGALFMVGIILCVTVVGAIPGTIMIFAGGGLMFAGFASLTKSTVKGGIAAGKFIHAMNKESGPATSTASAALPAKWAALVELDPEIAAAAGKARAYGDGCERLLAEKYLVLGDKQYLQSALQKAVETFQQQQEEIAAMRQLSIPDLPPDGGKTNIGYIPFHYSVDASGVYTVTKGQFTGFTFASYPELKEFYLKETAKMTGKPVAG